MSEQPTAPPLPTPAELSKLWQRLADTEDAVKAQVARAFQAANYEDEQRITYADIGALAIFARDLGRFGEELAELGERLNATLFNDLDLIVLDGRQGSIPQVDEHGSPNYRDGELTEHAAERYLYSRMREPADA